MMKIDAEPVLPLAERLENHFSDGMEMPASSMSLAIIGLKRSDE